MRKRIIIICVLLIIGLLAFWMINNKNEEDEKEVGGGFEVTQEVRYKPGSEDNTPGGGTFDIEEGYTHKYELDVDLKSGEVVFFVYVYEGSETNPETGEITMKRGALIRKETINESGLYSYPLDDLSYGQYVVVVDEKTEDTEANVIYKFIQKPNK